MREEKMVGWHHRLSGLELSKFRELVMDRETCRAAVQGFAKSQTGLSDCTELIYMYIIYICKGKKWLTRWY